MFDWVLAQGDERAKTHAAALRSLARGDLFLVALPLGNKQVTIARAEGCFPRKRVTWPELLVDWSEINEEAPYPAEASPALAQTLSELGVPAFAVAFDPARDAAAVAWYERGQLIQLEHIGRSVVAWTPEEGLGRPRMSGLAGGVASLARSLGGDENILDRIEAQHASGARAIVERVLVRLCNKPPPVDDVAGMVAMAAADQYRL